jgi:hypothetical protein
LYQTCRGGPRVSWTLMRLATSAPGPRSGHPQRTPHAAPLPEATGRNLFADGLKAEGRPCMDGRPSSFESVCAARTPHRQGPNEHRWRHRTERLMVGLAHTNRAQDRSPTDKTPLRRLPSLCVRCPETPIRWDSFSERAGGSEPPLSPFGRTHPAQLFRWVHRNRFRVDRTQSPVIERLVFP